MGTWQNYGLCFPHHLHRPVLFLRSHRSWNSFGNTSHPPPSLRWTGQQSRPLSDVWLQHKAFRHGACYVLLDSEGIHEGKAAVGARERVELQVSIKDVVSQRGGSLLLVAAQLTALHVVVQHGDELRQPQIARGIGRAARDHFVCYLHPVLRIGLLLDDYLLLFQVDFADVWADELWFSFL